jgi:predicted N-acetyltransferase YhbS
MLVNLLKLPPLAPVLEQMRELNITIRRAQVFEQTPVRAFVEKMSVSWADEISVAYANKPVTLFIATRQREILGFSAYECTRRNFFGPMAVAQEERGQGIGKALLLACLHGMEQLGYVYGIIGGVGPADFYEHTVGAIRIFDSTPGIYTDLLHKD